MRPKARPENMKKKKKKSGAPTRSLRPRARPEMIGGMPGGSTRGIDPMENYGPEGVERLTGGMKAGGKVKKGYAAGGKTKGAAKGGKVRGAGIARKGVRPAKMI